MRGLCLQSRASSVLRMKFRLQIVTSMCNTAAPLAHASETRAVFVEIDWIEFDYGAVAATRVLVNVLPIH